MMPINILVTQFRAYILRKICKLLVARGDHGLLMSQLLHVAVDLVKNAVLCGAESVLGTKQVLLGLVQLPHRL